MTSARISWTLPLRSFLTRPTSLRCGLCGRWRFWFCSPSFLAHFHSLISSRRNQRFTAVSPTHRESESSRSDIRSGAYFSAYGAKPPEALPARGAPTEPPSGFGTIRAVGLLQRRAELSPVDFVFFPKSGFGLST